MGEIEDAAEALREEYERTLTQNAATAHMAGDIQAQKALRMKLKMDLVNEEAAKFAKAYKKDLQAGGSYIEGDWVPWLKDRTEDDKRRISNIIERGYLEGKDTGSTQYAKGGKYGLYPKDTIAGDLQDYFNKRRSHASMVARTEIARIQTRGSLNRYKKQQVQKVMWLTFQPCPICAQYNRRVFKTTDLPAEVPVHPNCRCALAPVPDNTGIGVAPEQEVPPGFQTPMPVDQPDVKYTKVNEMEMDDAGEDILGLGRRERTDLTAEHRRYLGQYKGKKFERFNAWNRGQTQVKKSQAETFTAMNNVIGDAVRKSRLPTDMKLYRGIPQDLADDIAKRGVYTDASFMSTANNLGSAQGFAKVADDGYKNIIQFKRAGGKPGLYMGGEREILLPRHMRLNLKEVKEVEHLTYNQAGYRHTIKARIYVMEDASPPARLPFQAQTIKHKKTQVTYDAQDQDWTDYTSLHKKGQITDDDVAAIEDYIYGDYHEFNLWLRKGDDFGDELAEEWVKRTGGDRAAIAKNLQERAQREYIPKRNTLDKLINDHPLQSDAVLYRGCGPTTAKRLMEDQIYDAHNYQSSSLNLRMAQSFGDRGEDGFKNVLVFKQKKGDKGFYTSPYESEVLMPRGTQYRLAQVREVDNTEYKTGTYSEKYDKIRYLIVEAKTP